MAKITCRDGTCMFLGCIKFNAMVLEIVHKLWDFTTDTKALPNVCEHYLHKLQCILTVFSIQRKISIIFKHKPFQHLETT